MPVLLTDRLLCAMKREIERHRQQLDGRRGLQEVTITVRLRNGELTRVYYSEHSEAEPQVA